MAEQIFSDRDYLNSRFDALSAQIVTSEKTNIAGLTAMQLTHTKEHLQESKAVEKALAINDRRLEEMNRFREENLEDRSKYLTRAEFFGYLSGVVTIVVASVTILQKLIP